MSTRKLYRAIQTSTAQILKAVRNLTRSLVHWLLRTLLMVGRQSRLSRAGFVLPTTILLVMVVLLTVGAIVFRTYTRTTETITDRQQRVIYNAATPAVDRARSKLSFLFDSDSDPRYPGGVPSENVLMGMMLNGATIDGAVISPHPRGGDPYTFEDETRIDVGTSYAGDAGADNAWRYRTDTDGDGTEDATVVYTISMRLDEAALSDTTQGNLANRAQNMLVRGTPLSISNQGDPLCAGAGAVVPQQGWLPPSGGNTAVLYKNFQVDAYVLPDRANLPVSTLEMQLDRQLDRGNKWGAWFRYDLEIFPGPQFNWNGAMHTEGNLMLGNGSFRGFMISDPDSCLYTEDASEVSIAQYGERTDAEGLIPAFQGQFLNGFTGRTNWDGRTHRFDLWDGAGRNPIQNQAFDRGNDSVNEGGLNPVDYAIDPVILFTRGESAHRNPAAFGTRRADWDDTDFAQRRLITPDQAVEVPYVDDTYRADNRYGPKPQYTSDLPVPGSIGERIPDTVVQLVGNAPAAGGDVGELGLDGYWERRARFEGMRLIVGQRLELGDPAGWGGPVLRTGDERDSLREALRPFATPSGAVNNACRDYNNAANNDNNARCEEARQRRSLWDNLAAVQAMVVYHASQAGTTDLDRPLACMASTVHPGTGGTLDNSATFQDLAYGLPNNAFSNTISAGRADYRDGTANEIPVLSDFLQGKGTNGWEYEFRDSYINDYSIPPSSITPVTSPLRVALNNLAHFAGDPRGGAPSFEPIQDNLVHPFPALSMYGDFSILRRVLQNLDNGTYTYATMPPADKATLNSATCMLGMLAYNLDYLAKFQPDQLPPALMGNAYPSIAAETAARASNPTQYYTGLRGLIRALINSGDGTPARGPVLTPLGLVPTIHDYSLNNNTDTGTGENPQYIGAGLNDANGLVNQPQTYVRLLERWRDEMPANYTIPGTAVTYTKEEMNAFIALAQLIINKEQVARDRVWGFYGSGVAANRTQTLSDGPFAGLYGPAGAQVRGCRGMQNAPGGTPGDSIRYLCSWRPRYPALYSIFPSPDLGGEVGRNEHGDINTLEADEGRNFTRDRIDSSDPQTRNYIGRADVNGGGFAYQSLTEEQVEAIVAYPRRMNAADWRLPVVTTAVSPNNTPTVSGDTLVKVCEDDVCLLDSAGELNRAGQEFWRLPFKDSGIFNGREMLAVRVLDVNVNFIRQQNRNLTNDFWLPLSGVIYAFREDAVSELNIVRPAAAAWTACNTETDLRTTNTCQMLTNRSAVSSQDPPLNANNRISPKPVDYFPDPDRRPHGFRVQNGARVDRPGDEGRGLSFISDNAAYVKGNFNLHNDAANPEEEFNEALQVNFGNFYGRNNLNPDFARPATDTWRPSEILADGVSILSNNFCDGSIEDSFITAGNGGGANLNNATRQRYGCNQNISSYLNQNRPRTNPNQSLATQAPNWRWFRTDVADGGLGYGKDGTGTAAGDFNFAEGTSPIYVSPNGNPWTAEASLANEPIYAGNYYRFEENKPLNNGTNGQRMNMILISGLVPSKEGQSYGGLHNFPRFLESWGGRNLFISGSIIQLNFSTQTTGPFDQDVWSPSAPDYGGERIRYYRPPNRRWGYDVALQYAPAGPVSQRFVSLQPRRNEFYSEPPADDPYMDNLLAGLCGSGPNPRPPQCP